MKTQKARAFTEQENQTWKILYTRLDTVRKSMAHPIFTDGLKKLNISGEKIPDLNTLNDTLKNLTGWQGCLVEGLENTDQFYPALARREFPIGNFIRDQADLNYTPAPDIFHDLYGHIPFYADKSYAEACTDYCVRASNYIDQPEKMRMFERFFWFTYEFCLMETSAGRKIFGGGILSSKGESEYSLSEKPEVIPFNIEKMIQQEFRIDIYQEKLFVLSSPEQLYRCNAEVEAAILSS